MTKTLHSTALLLATAATGLALAGCKVDNRPLAARGQPAADAYAQPANALAAPAPGPLDPAYAQNGYAQNGYAQNGYAPTQYAQPDLSRPMGYLAPDQAYAYPCRAARVSRAYHDARPSYGFAYESEQPWVWASADEDVMFAEPYETGYRYYYYEPGVAYPYFIQDADYGYAYDDTGVLIALFDAVGTLVSYDRYHDYYPRAHDYWARGYALDQAYRVSPRYRVEESVWRQRAPVVTAGRERWFQAASAQPAWRQVALRSPRALPRLETSHGAWSRERAAATARIAAQAAPAAGWRQAGSEPPHGWRGGPSEAHGRLARESIAHAPAAHAPASANPGWREARQAHGGGQAAERASHPRGPMPQAAAPVRQARLEAGGGHGAHRGGGPQFERAPSAPSAVAHGRNAAFHGQDRPQAAPATQGGGAPQAHEAKHGGGGGQPNGGHGRGHDKG
jgi:hypothetical protein